jgi:hypothetical protein
MRHQDYSELTLQTASQKKLWKTSVIADSFDTIG